MSFGDDTLEVLHPGAMVQVQAAHVYKVYLAGPMRGYPNFNFPAFDYAAARLRKQGCVVFSPAERDRETHPDIENNPTGDIKNIPAGASLAEFMEADTRWICRHATAVALLPGWEKSKGVAVELALAKCLGLTVIELGKEYVQK